MKGHPINSGFYDIDLSLSLDLLDDNFSQIILPSFQNIWNQEINDEKIEPTNIPLNPTEEQKLKEKQDEKKESDKSQKGDEQEKQKRNIDYNPEILKGRKKLAEGRVKETSNLSKYMKDSAVKFFRGLIKLKCLGPQQLKLIQQFNHGNGSLHSFSRIFKNEKISTLTENYFCSPEFICQILRSKKLQIQRKMEIIKYLQKLRQCCRGQIKRWKQKPKYLPPS